MSALHELMATIEDRRQNLPEHSYTTQLFHGGVEKIGVKILEEAAEVVQAAHENSNSPGREHVVHESVDLIYHLFVLLGHQGIGLAEVEAEVARRFGISGIDEKASRTKTKES